jgi:hypothetical protein
LKIIFTERSLSIRSDFIDLNISLNNPYFSNTLGSAEPQSR